MSKSSILFSLLFIVCSSQNAFSQQHIEDCESFLDSDLTLLCYQHSIVSELENNQEFLPPGMVSLTITEEGEINDLLLYGSWDYRGSLPKLFSHFSHHWIPLPVPKVTSASDENYYQLVVEVFPSGHVVARSDMEKREF